MKSCRFAAGKQKVIVVSKAVNSAVDLPNANIVIQISGSFGSRQKKHKGLVDYETKAGMREAILIVLLDHPAELNSP